MVLFMAHSPSFARELQDRGFVFDLSSPEALSSRLEKPLTLYMGFDVTAPSFHAGHLMPIMLLKHFQNRGHRIIVILGTGTSRIGDPSDKKSERPMMSPETIAQNAQALRAMLTQLLGEERLILLDNAEWLGSLSHLDFLRDVGRHFSVNRMVSFDFIKNRLQQNLPLSFLEMSYLLLQSYDFLFLNDRYDCCLQIGGQDQWANMISGTELIRKTRKKEAFVLTCPLLLTSDGKKMGKSETGAIWLDPSLLSPYDFWQFWRNVSDVDVVRFLKLFTFLPLQEIEKAAQETGADLNSWKALLADHVTTFVHGEKGLQEAQQKTRALFQEGQETSGDVADLSSIEQEGRYALLDVLVAVGFVSSKAQARRAVREGAVRLGNDVLCDENHYLTKNTAQGKPLKLSLGKKKHVLLNVSDLPHLG